MVLSTSDDGWTAGTPLDGADRSGPTGAAGHRDERRAAADRARLPGTDGRSRPVRLRLGDQVGHRAQGHHLRRGPGLLDAAGLVGPRPDQARLADRRAALESPSTRGTVVVAGVAWAQHTGHRQGRGADRPGRLAAGAQLAETIGPDTWRQWRFDWAGDRRAPHRSPSGPPTRTGSCRSPTSRRPLRTAPPATTASRSRSGSPTVRLRAPCGRSFRTGRGRFSGVRIAVARESAPGEARVALVPELVGKLNAAGYEMAVEPGAGAAAMFADEAYAAAGGESADRRWSRPRSWSASSRSTRTSSPVSARARRPSRSFPPPPGPPMWPRA